jgi:hypothetical protein
MRPKSGAIVLWGKSGILKNQFGLPSMYGRNTRIR